MTGPALLSGALFQIAGQAPVQILGWFNPARWGYAAAAATTDFLRFPFTDHCGTTTRSLVARHQSIDKWEETPQLTRIYATIRVERDGQKAIVIGRERRHAEAASARWRAEEMEKLFGVRIYLDLHVRVQPGWREKSTLLNALDWRTMAGEDES